MNILRASSIILILPFLGVVHYAVTKTGIFAVYLLSLIPITVGLLRYKYTPILWIVGANWIAAVCACVTGETSLFHQIGIAAWFIGITAMIPFASDPDKIIRYIIASMVIYSAILLATIIKSGELSLGGHYHSPDPQAHPFELSSLDPGMLLGMLAVAFGASCWHNIRSAKIWNAALCFVAFVPFIIETLFLNRRAAVGAAAIALCSVVVGRASCLFVLLFGFLPLWWTPLANNISFVASHSEIARDILVRSEETDLSDGHTRDYLWEAVITKIQDPKMDLYYFFGDRDMVSNILSYEMGGERVCHAHNAVLQSFVQSGIIGMIAWILLLFSAAITLWKSKQKRSAGHAIAWAWVIYVSVVGGMESISLVPTLGLVLFSLSLGLLTAYENTKTPWKSSHQIRRSRA